MTTESKSIGQSYVHFALLCFVEREVQVIVDVFVVITLFVVDGRRNNATAISKDAAKVSLPIPVPKLYSGKHSTNWPWKSDWTNW